MSDPPRLSLIVAMAENGIIGRDGAMPWRLSSDLKRFRKLTMNKPMIMGRKTYDSIGKPLDGRDTVILTRQPGLREKGAHVAHSMKEALALAARLAAARRADEIMVIGGAEIYRETLPLAQRIYLTRVHAALEGDTRFPELRSEEWRRVAEESHPAGPRDEFGSTFTILDRIAA